MTVHTEVQYLIVCNGIVLSLPFDTCRKRERDCDWKANFSPRHRNSNNFEEKSNSRPLKLKVTIEATCLCVCVTVCTWCAGIVIPRKKDTEGEGEKKRFRYVTSSRKKPKKSEKDGKEFAAQHSLN